MKLSERLETLKKCFQLFYVRKDCFYSKIKTLVIEDSYSATVLLSKTNWHL